jgi:hypothetical protein
MEKLKQDQIPRSIIKGTGAIGADLSSLNGKGKVLFADPRCFVIGVNDLPYAMFATPVFRAKFLPIDIRESIYGIKNLIFKPSFFVGKKHTPMKPCEISSWVTDFKKIECLQLENVNLDDLISLKDLPIEQLSLKSVIYTNDQQIIRSIKHFKCLKEIFYDYSLTNNLKHELEKLHVKMTMITAI